MPADPGVLAEFDLTTLAIAVKGADAAVCDEIYLTLSGRARAGLEEEACLLASQPAAKIDAVRTETLSLVRRLEEDGKLTLDS